MSLIKAENINFSYYSSLAPVFSGLTFTADCSWKTALVGGNGSGKTTLFKILCGEERAGGRLVADVRFSRFPFDVSDDETVSDLSATCGEGGGWKFLRELTLLGLDEDILYRPFGTLSGGERTKAMLAALFCSENFPLIDEPTDSLDIVGRRRLAEYLKTKRGYIVASHDRAFLNACTDHTLHLSDGKAELICGNYSVWKEESDRRAAYNAQKKQRLETEAERMFAAADRTKVWANRAEREKFGVQKSGLKADRGFVSASAARVMKRSKTAAQRRTEAAEEAKRLASLIPSGAAKLSFPPLICRKQCVLSLTNCNVFAGGVRVIEAFSLNALRGERIALTGANGCGKSTLLKAIARAAGGFPENAFDFSCAAADPAPDTGGVVVSYVSQACEDVRGTPAEYAAEWKIEEPAFKSMLAKLGFANTDWNRDMSLLSTGQRKKAALARSLLTPAHLYVWDEPFNYLDVTAREAVEEAVLNSSPAIIFVEHDEEFVVRAATKVIKL